MTTSQQSIQLKPTGSTTSPIAFTLQPPDADDGAAIMTRHDTDVMIPYHAHPLSHGQGHIHISGQRLPYVIRQDENNPNRFHLWVNGTTVSLERIQSQRRKQGGSQTSSNTNGQVQSPMPGKILQILVQEGDLVETGQPLLMMESMKMEITLSAPIEGKVTQINTTPHSMVDMGTVLIKITP